MNQEKLDFTVPALLLGGLASLWLFDFWNSLSPITSALMECLALIVVAGLIMWAWESKTPAARKRLVKIKRVREIPDCLRLPSPDAVRLGRERDLALPIYLPDSIRSRHVHVLGATGSGKTESVILNFLKQDVKRGLGAIILDAKGDASFLKELRGFVCKDKLKVFDLSTAESLAFDPLTLGSSMEAAQRLFASLTWSEEYYKYKALSALQQLFENHRKARNVNPTIADLASYLKTAKTYGSCATAQGIPEDQIKKDFADLSGLRDQLLSLSSGHLKGLLSPPPGEGIKLASASEDLVLYFRLQSLLSPTIVASVGKLLINCMSYMAGSAHRETSVASRKMTPVFLDEFASFACPEFAELISKARSAGYALHFSHQSVGDLVDVSPGFLSQVTDNSATKIVLRINDPDSAEYFSRTFGTQLTRKITQRVENSHEVSTAEVQGVGSMRETQEFRASPDLLKTLPVGEGAVLIAHGFDTPHGASTVFRIKFPSLKGEQ
jgi:hypothetical protein